MMSIVPRLWSSHPCRCLMVGLLLFGAGLTGASCSFTSSLDETSCQSNADCPDNASCEDGYCVDVDEGDDNCVDRDGDDAVAGNGCTKTPADCDDSNSNIHPDADEQCDSLDNDCDGNIDEDFKNRRGSELSLGDVCHDGQGVCRRQGVGVCADDGDGLSCTAEAADPSEEVCDGRDNDCNGVVDDVDGETPVDHADDDEHCGRCGNNCLELFPNATGTCNDGGCEIGGCEDHRFDLDGRDQNGCEYLCEASQTAEMNGEILPDADTTCDGLDDDCDGDVDEDVEITVDGNAKTLGDACTVGTGECQRSGKFVCEQNGDEATCSVEAARSTPELCDGRDNDCDGEVDEGDPLDGDIWYRDEDGDGYGVASNTSRVCSDQTPPTGYADQSGDCAPNDPDIHPGADETCNGKDDDCDGGIDEGAETSTWYEDTDDDGYGDDDTANIDCQNPGGSTTWVEQGGDCDDGDPEVNPGGDEICDDVDNDCDGNTDEGCDKDGDGYCDQGTTVSGSAQNRSICPETPAGTGDDCDDSRTSIHPGAAPKDSQNACMKDADDDGYGDAAPLSRVTSGSDCDDGDQDINPEGTEVCDGADNDCDGEIDEAYLDAAESCTGDCQCHSGTCDGGSCSHRIFVTSTSFAGDLGGLDSGSTNADAKCQTHADDENLEGTWQAVLSDSNADAKDRIDITTSIINLRGTNIADGSNDFWDGNLTNPVAYDETMQLVASSVSRYDWSWTGTESDGRNNGVDTCSDWTSADSNDDGVAGDAGDTDSNWLNNASRECDNTYRLYCIDGQ